MEREDMLFDHTLQKNKKALREGEVYATLRDPITSDLSFILQHLINAIQNLDQRIQEVED